MEPEGENVWWCVLAAFSKNHIALIHQGEAIVE